MSAFADFAKTDYRPGVKCQRIAKETFAQPCSDSNVEEWRSLLPVVVLGTVGKLSKIPGVDCRRGGDACCGQ